MWPGLGIVSHHWRRVHPSCAIGRARTSARRRELPLPAPARLRHANEQADCRRYPDRDRKLRPRPAGCRAPTDGRINVFRDGPYPSYPLNTNHGLCLNSFAFYTTAIVKWERARSSRIVLRAPRVNNRPRRGITTRSKIKVVIKLASTDKCLAMSHKSCNGQID